MDNKRSVAAVGTVVAALFTLAALSSTAEGKISASCAIWCQARCMGTGQQFDSCVQRCYIVCERTGRPPLGESGPADYCNVGCVTASCLGSTHPDSEEARTCVASCDDKCLEIPAGGIN